MPFTSTQPANAVEAQESTLGGHDEDFPAQDPGLTIEAPIPRQRSPTHEAIRLSVTAAFQNAANMLQEPATNEPGLAVGRSSLQIEEQAAHTRAVRNGSIRGGLTWSEIPLSPEEPWPRQTGLLHESPAEVCNSDLIEERAMDFLDSAPPEADDDRLLQGKCRMCADMAAACLFGDFEDF